MCIEKNIEKYSNGKLIKEKKYWHDVNWKESENSIYPRFQSAKIPVNILSIS